MAVKYIKVRFNLEKEEDKKAYQYITDSDVSASKCVIQLINNYLNRDDCNKDLNKFVEIITDRITGILENVQLTAGTKTTIEDDPETDELIANFMDFFN